MGDVNSLEKTIQFLQLFAHYQVIKYITSTADILITQVSYKRYEELQHTSLHTHTQLYRQVDTYQKQMLQGSCWPLQGTGRSWPQPALAHWLLQHQLQSQDVLYVTMQIVHLNTIVWVRRDRGQYVCMHVLLCILYSSHLSHTVNMHASMHALIYST